MFQPIYRRLLRLPLERALAPLGSDPSRSDGTLRRIVEEFVFGYNAALAERETGQLPNQLDRVEARWRGFAYEGAAMALGLLDELPLGGSGRWQRLTSIEAPQHDYLLHVGVGWAWARLARDLDPRLERLDPTLRWLCVDGYGFHHGFFHAERTISRQQLPAACRGYAKRAFDQGLGRSLWFFAGASPPRVRSAIAMFAAGRHDDLWSGVGLAVAYAGGVSVDSALQLAHSAGSSRPHFAQGVAFALEARARGATPYEHTSEFAAQLWKQPAHELVDVVARTREMARGRADEEVYEDWRGRLREQFSTQEARHVVAQ